MAVVTILGAGMMGSALSMPARDNGHQVRLVGTHLDGESIARLRAGEAHPTLKRRLPPGVRAYTVDQAREAVAGADLIVCGVSSFGVPWFCREMLPLLAEGAPLLAVTKGLDLLEDETLRTFPETFRAMLPPGSGLSLNAVGGPCTSYELADRHHTHVTFCGEDLSTLRGLKALLETSYYHVSLSTDVTGVEAAVALKNAFALGVTLAVGMARRDGGEAAPPHYNTQAALFGQSAREMAGLLRLLGGDQDALALGIGDLYVTIFGGRTRLLGTLLGKGLTVDAALKELDGVTLESVAIARRIGRALRRMAGQGRASLADYPLLLHVDGALSGGPAVPLPWDRFARG